MGADIEFENGETYRDSYNNSNLAWVIAESYWNCQKEKQDRNEFMKKLALITDVQINRYVYDTLSKRAELEMPPNKSFDFDGWIKMFQEKRDFLKGLLDKGELKVAEDGWSV